MQQDTSKIKEKIINFLKVNGPSLPVHIAKEIGMNTLFASAFLSELMSDKKIKTSYMNVGSSKIYLLPGQEQKLENFSHHLKSKEKDAFLILKEKKFLKDSEIQPAIRVALRKIKDFAIPYETHEGIIWKYFSVSDEEFKDYLDSKLQKPIQEQKAEKSSKETFEKPKAKKTKSSKKSSKKDEKFFNKVKEFLEKKQFAITGIEGFNKSELILKIKKNQEEFLLIAFNKKRILEKDIIKAGEKAEEYQLKYYVLSLGEPLKKIKKFINAVKNLSEVQKIE